MARHTIDKKTLREDAVQDRMFWIVDWGFRHRNTLIAVAVTFVILVGAAFGYQAYREAEAHRLTLAFFEVEKQLADPGLDLKTRREMARKGYSEFVRANPGERLTPIAWMHLARLAWDAEAPQESREAYNSVLNHGKSTPALKDLARLGLAKVEEAEKNLEEAEKLYRQLSDDPYASLKAYHLGRIALQRDRPDEARRHFEQALQGNNPSIVAQWAKQSLDFHSKP